MRGVAAHASTATPSVTTATDGDEDGAGMHLEMTVACLAVVAGLLLLATDATPPDRSQPRRRARSYPLSGPGRPGPTSHAIT